VGKVVKKYRRLGLKNGSVAEGSREREGNDKKFWVWVFLVDLSSSVCFRQTSTRIFHTF
jgi:hypothetical protein